MNGCVYRTKNGECILDIEDGKYHAFCVGVESCEDRKQSNADRVRAMTDESLADYHAKMCGCPPGHDPIFCGMATIGCKGCWFDWLKQEAQVD